MPQMSPTALTSTPRSSTPSASGRRSHAERLTEALSQAYTRRHYVDLTITLRDQVSFNLHFHPLKTICDDLPC